MYMRKSILLTVIVFGAMLSAGIIFAEENTTSSLSVGDLKSSIETKAQELKVINNEIANVEVSLSQTKAKTRGISEDISRLHANIRQLDLRVQAGELTVEKLRLELKELSINIQDIETSVYSKRQAVAASLRIMQQNDRDNLLVILLRNGSLTESVSEAQNIFDLNNGLSVEITSLKSLQENLNEKVSVANDKKQDIEKETQNTKYRQTLAEEQKKEREQLLGLTKAQQKEYEAKRTELEKQQEAISKVIDELEYKLRSSFDSSLLPLKRPGVLSYPVQNPVVTQEYGETAFAQSAYKSKTHNGIDFNAPVGTAIYAAEDGVVMASDNNDVSSLRWQKFQYGRYILIEHENNLATLYAHLSKSLVHKGDHVKRGDIIGYSGNTGYATGPHLHFGVYWAPSIQLKSISPAAGLVPIGVTINPRDYL